MTAFNIVHAREARTEGVQEVGSAQRATTWKCAAPIWSDRQRTYHFIGEWDSMEQLVAARPLMIKNLDASRPFLEDLGEEKGVTDAVSGEEVVELFRRPPG